LETREHMCVPRAAKSFFIPGVHSPPGAVGHVAAPELPSQEARALSSGTCGSTGAHLRKESMSGATRLVAAPELFSARRRGLGLRNTWWCWSTPLQGGEVQSCGNTWQRRSSAQQRGEVRERGTHGGTEAHLYSLRGSVWIHALLLVLI
jgi:hypothetical protein